MKRSLMLCLLPFVNACACYVVDPGNRGVLVRLGEVDPKPLPEGFGTKNPFTASVTEVSVRQRTAGLDAPCFSSDLQQVKAHVKVLYRVPEASVVSVYRDYAGEPFDTLIAPRVQEALKESTATMTAEQIVKQREHVKAAALELAKAKVGTLLVIEDIVIENVDLSRELEHAIEQKMVQEQEAAKAKFVQQKTQIEAETAAIRAEGEAKAIRIRGQALKETPQLIDLQIVEKWNGVSPLVVGEGGRSANMLLPLSVK